ncbi:SirB1 family protein [Sphingomonas faeni]|uniref:SirB1 family protein n=1 Tax=Sphingomonas faeni TaxID=185950 RepID=UPI00277D4EDC|nr:transglutaminase-like domain-containing protein [Sphingomonas faeni]MDQ0837341.1 regulator of sirC expression with transglutaminase-like and TPR domain [Sphingomonas faeni]
MNENLIRLGLLDEGDIILDEAALSLALLDHPDVDPTPYRTLLDEVATRLDVVGRNASGASDRADVLSQVLHEEFGFVGDRDTYDDPANADLIRVVDRRRGLPVSLSILYVGAARRIGWEADALDVPGHVLVMVGAEAAPVIVDPFREGMLVDREALAALLLASTSGPAAAVSHIAAMPNRAILVRLLLNQATRAEHNGQGRRALELYTRMTLMAPDYGHAWWERARLELVDGDVTAARGSLSAMLEITRDPDLRRRVTDTLKALPAT